MDYHFMASNDLGGTTGSGHICKECGTYIFEITTNEVDLNEDKYQELKEEVNRVAEKLSVLSDNLSHISQLIDDSVDDLIVKVEVDLESNYR